MRVRVLYATAGVLALLGLWLRLARSALPSPRADAAELPAPAAGRGAPAPAQQPPAAGFEAIAAANIFSQTRTAPSVRFVPVGQAAKRAAPAAPRAPALKLYGTTLSPQGAVAIIDADPKVPGAEIYRLGDLVAGARLVAITDSDVTLAKPSGPLVLRLPPTQGKKP